MQVRRALLHSSPSCLDTNTPSPARTDFGTLLRKDGVFFVFRKAAFSWGKKAEKERIEATMAVGEERDLGGWRVRVEEAGESEGVGKKAWCELEELMEGKFEYSVDVVEGELKRIGVIGTAKGAEIKPHAFKGIHEKLLNSLPLLDNAGGRVAKEVSESEGEEEGEVKKRRVKLVYTFEP